MRVFSIARSKEADDRVILVAVAITPVRPFYDDKQKLQEIVAVDFLRADISQFGISKSPLLDNRLKAHNHRPDIEVVTNYRDLPEVECFPGQLKQVFTNILANAIDALDESNYRRKTSSLIPNWAAAQNLF